MLRGNLNAGGCIKGGQNNTVIPQTEPCVQCVDLVNQQAMRDRRLNKNMKLWIKTCLGSNEYHCTALFSTEVQSPITD